ncbi:site-specific integrase [Nonomuraea sp. NPDC049152]|uniref:tyrosine-type recombinase/integrase n=1 Tax=Nonomuraea sp. NPDC049152 TaxID=3154350 RepID=UPI003410C095
MIGDVTISFTHRAVLQRVAESAEAASWSARTLRPALAGLVRIFDGHPDGQPVRRSQLNTELGGSSGARLARMVLDEAGLFLDDTVSTMRLWVERQSGLLPKGFRADVRTWLIVLLEGSARTKARSESTLYAYFGRVRPHLLAWSETRNQLREITENDVSQVLDALSGHQRAGTFTALRSLFQFAKRHRLIFADPTRRLSVGRAPGRVLQPMTDAEIAEVKRTGVTPEQRLVVALAAVYAMRASAIRHLTLDDIDLPRRLIRLRGHQQKLSEFAHRALVDWLHDRHRKWPHTPNRHVLISWKSAASTEPVSDYYLTWRLLLLGVQLEQIRGDRVLQEALVVNVDPLHLELVFNLSSQTAIEYADIARSLLERPIEAAQSVF